MHLLKRKEFYVPNKTRSLFHKGLWECMQKDAFDALCWQINTTDTRYSHFAHF